MMKVVVFGATGMVGHGVLLEALDAVDVEEVVVVVRRSTKLPHPKLREVLHSDFADLSALPADVFAGAAACFYCLGVSSFRMSEADYRRVSFDFPIAAARALVARAPDAAFTFVTGAGTDSTGAGRVMWARVKGQAENELLALTSSSWMFRPGVIVAERGVVSATPWLARVYTLLSPLIAVMKVVTPNALTTTSMIGRAMLNAVRTRPPLRRLEVKDINALAQRV